MQPFQPDGALTEVARQIKKGQCILFLGAGVHAPPPEEAAQGQDPAPAGTPLETASPTEPARPEYHYPPEVRPLMGGDLAEELAEDCGYAIRFPRESVRDLQRVSLCYEKSPGFGRAKLVQRLNQCLMLNKKPSPILNMLAEMPFRIIVTTNYDRLMEAALRAKEKEPTVVVYDPDFNRNTRDVGEEPEDKHPLIFKMHGDLTQNESIVITDEDYITFVQRMAASGNDQAYPVPVTVRYRMQKWSILFVGYSLRDYNLRLLFRTLRWRLDPANFPPTFSIDRHPDPLILQVYQNERQFITFVTEDLWSSVPYLYKAVTEKEYGNE